MAVVSLRSLQTRRQAGTPELRRVPRIPAARPQPIKARGAARRAVCPRFPFARRRSSCLRRKWVWISMIALAAIEVAGWAWADLTREYSDPSELPYTAATPSAGSLHSAPSYGTKVRFENSARSAFARAGREDKLVLLLHLSGRFSSSETT